MRTREKVKETEAQADGRFTPMSHEGSYLQRWKRNPIDIVDVEIEYEGYLT